MKDKKDVFINRERELAWLEECHKKATYESQLLIIYGKRRVGKTELARHFVKDKKCIYYLANRTTAQEQLQSATAVFAAGFGDTYLQPGSFSNWRNFFDYLGKKTKESQEPVIVVFDEYPFLVESHRGLSSFFQYGWDEALKGAKILMILMGSSIAMMYKHALTYNAPLYGRRTGQWLLEPFTFKETKEFYPGCSFEHTFPLYAITGGMPAYARIFDGRKTLAENIARCVLPEGAFLSVEPELLLADEFTDQRSYLTILQTIGLGRTKFSEIAQASGLPATALPGYLKTLINLRLVKKETPITEPVPEKSKKGNYSIADAFLRFYFSFIFPNSSLVKSGSYDALFHQRGETLTRLVAKRYEEASYEFVAQASAEGALPHFEKMGRWWNKNTEIDLVGLNTEDNAILFVEAKWKAKPLDSDVLDDLLKKARKVQWGKQGRREYYAVVAKGGFTDALRKRAQKEGVVLIFEDRIMQ